LLRHCVSTRHNKKAYMTAEKTVSLVVSLMRKEDERLYSNAADVDA